VEITPASTGLDSSQFPEFYNESTDGYAWHLYRLRSGDRTYREFEASGNGGQLLIVVPELELTVVFTAGNYMQGGIWGRFRDDIVAREVIRPSGHDGDANGSAVRARGGAREEQLALAGVAGERCRALELRPGLLEAAQLGE
jgi:CubicO group peptidase (beta-lactamase class C family)